MKWTATDPMATSDIAIEKSKPIMTVIEVARELRCSKSHVHHLIAGTVPNVAPLPCVSLGRRRIIRRATFELWLKANEHGAML